MFKLKEVVRSLSRALTCTLNYVKPTIPVRVASRDGHLKKLPFKGEFYNYRRHTEVELVLLLLVTVFVTGLYWLHHLIAPLVVFALEMVAFAEISLGALLSVAIRQFEVEPVHGDSQMDWIIKQTKERAGNVVYQHQHWSTEIRAVVDSYAPTNPLPWLAVVMCASLFLRYCLPYNALSHSNTMSWRNRVFEDHAFLATAFRRIAITRDPPPIQGHHSHPLAAAKRNTADSNINSFIRANGYQAYSVQMSRRDIDNSIPGCFVHHWVSDLRLNERKDALPARPMLKFINVDYYIDWYDYLVTGLPIVMYTFDPIHSSGVLPNEEGHWHANPDNTVTLSVRGCPEYTHKLWDYNDDHVHAVYPSSMVVYGLEKVRIDDVWSIVIMIPRKIAERPRASTMGLSLRHRVLVETGVNMLGDVVTSAVSRYIANGVPTISLSYPRPGTHVSVPLSVIYDMEARLVAAMKRGKRLEPHDIVNYLRAFIEDDLDSITATTQLMTLVIPKDVHPTYRLSPAQTVNPHYWKLPAAGEHLRKEPGQPARILCPSLAGPAYVPARSLPNERWSVEERVTALHNPMTRLTPEFERFSAEFIDIFAADLEPITPTHVAELQTKVAQRAKNARSLPALSDWLYEKRTVVKSFLKVEAYGTPKDPRLISTLPPEHCLAYSCFTMPAAKSLSQQPWYAFSKTPKQVATRLQELALRHSHVVETDFSRFDGTHSQALYNFELSFLKRCFRPMYHRQLEELHRCQYNPKAFTKSKFAYDTRGSRLSGSADTSLGNTLDNAFVAYCALRRLGHAPKEAAKRLGLYGGDDGLSYDMDGTVYERTAADLGLKLKVTPKFTTEPTNMLGRVYLSPRTSTGSIADPVRAITKLHVTVDEQSPLMLCAVNKASGFLVTDRFTPILGVWAKRVVELNPGISPTELAYNAQAGGVDLPKELFEVARTYVARAFGVDASVIDEIEGKIQKATALKDFPHDPLPFVRTTLPPGTHNISEEVTIPVSPVSPTKPKKCPKDSAPKISHNAPRPDSAVGKRKSSDPVLPTSGPKVPLSSANPLSSSQLSATRKASSKTLDDITLSSLLEVVGGPVLLDFITSTASTLSPSSTPPQSTLLLKELSQLLSTPNPPLPPAPPTTTSPPQAVQSPAASTLGSNSKCQDDNSSGAPGTNAAPTLPSSNQPPPASSTLDAQQAASAQVQQGRKSSAVSRSSSTSKSPNRRNSPPVHPPSSSQKTKRDTRRSSRKTRRSRSRDVVTRSSERERKMEPSSTEQKPPSETTHTDRRGQSRKPSSTSSGPGRNPNSSRSSLATTSSSSPQLSPQLLPTEQESSAKSKQELNKETISRNRRKRKPRQPKAEAET